MTYLFGKGTVRVSAYTQMRNGKLVRVEGYERSAVAGKGHPEDERSRREQEILGGGEWFEDMQRIIKTYGPSAMTLLGKLLLTRKNHVQPVGPVGQSLSSHPSLQISSHPSNSTDGGYGQHKSFSLIESHEFQKGKQWTEQDMIQSMLSQMSATEQEYQPEYKPFFRQKDKVDMLGITHDLSKMHSSYSKMMGNEVPWLEFDGKYLRWYVGRMAWWEWPAVSGRDKYRSDRSFSSLENQKMAHKGPIPAGYYLVPQKDYQEIKDIPLGSGLIKI